MLLLLPILIPLIPIPCGSFGAGCLLLRHCSGYYTINDFEIKEMFCDYQTFFCVQAEPHSRRGMKREKWGKRGSAGNTGRNGYSFWGV